VSGGCAVSSLTGTADIGTQITNPVVGDNLAVGRRWRKDHGLRSWVVSRSPSCPCKPGTPGGPQRQLESPDNLPLQAGNTHAAATSVGGSGESMVDTAETKPAAIGSNNFVRQ